MKSYRKSVSALLLLFTALSPVAYGEVLPAGTQKTSASAQTTQQFQKSQASAQNLVNSKNVSAALAATTITNGVVIVRDQFGRIIRRDTYSNGLVTQQDFYNPSTGRLTERQKHSYNSQRVRIQTLYYNSSLRLFQKDTFNGTTGKITQSDTYNPSTGALTGRKRYFYSASGTQVNAYDASLRLKSSDYYDNTSLLVKQETYSTTGLKTSLTTYVYNASRQLVSSQKTIYGSTGKITEVQDKDGQNRLVKKTVYKNALISEIFEYNPVTGQIIFSETYVYSPFTSGTAGLIRVDRFDRTSGTAVKIKTDYYANGLVTSRVEYYTNGSPMRVTLFVDGNVLYFDGAVVANPAAIQSWFSQLQLSRSSGLIASHPDDHTFIYHDGIVAEWAKIYANTQAYTYDQGLAGITMLKEGNFAGAKKIFDFYYGEMKAEAVFSGFWTVYNTDAAFHWKKYEWRKGMGESAWIALFALQYYTLVSDPAEKAKGLEMATIITKWISTLPHFEGAVAMSPAGDPNFGKIYSTENNLDYYSLLKTLMTRAVSSSDRALFTTEFNNLKTWLRTKAYDPVKGLFRRGGNTFSGTFQWDGLQSLDVNSWAISAIGVSTLVSEFGINIDNFLTRIQQSFAVQNNGSFGGNVWTAKGFDFSDAANASAIGRTGMKWVEGTGQMILAYQLVAAYYASTSPAKSIYYSTLAAHFLNRTAQNIITVNGTTTYSYADSAWVQIYATTANWKTFPGQAAASAAWVYFSLKNFNPFQF